MTLKLIILCSISHKDSDLFNLPSRLLCFSIALQRWCFHYRTPSRAAGLLLLGQNWPLQCRNWRIYLGSNTEELPQQQWTQCSPVHSAISSWMELPGVKWGQNKVKGKWNLSNNKPGVNIHCTEPEQGQHGHSLLAVLGCWEFWADVNRMNT